MDDYRDDDAVEDDEDRWLISDARADAFRCPGCEDNTGDGRLCWRCRLEEDALTGTYCSECDIRTNHTAEQHRQAELPALDRQHDDGGEA